MKLKNAWVAVLGLFVWQHAAFSQEGTGEHDQRLTLRGAVSAAIANDPWLAGNRHSQDAMDALGVAAGTLPDPRISLGFANIPTDTFDFDQGAMSQFKLGLTQTFPRGDSRALRQKQMATLSGKFPLERQDRIARLTATVSELWLDTYRAGATRKLIESNRELFEQLVDVVTLNYSTALQGSRQQDVIRAQLELTRIEDRLLVLQQQFEMSSQRLREWLAIRPLEQFSALLLPEELPEVQLALGSPQPTVNSLESVNQQRLLRHPAVLALDQKIASATTGIALAKQKYKPEWGVSASYGYRDNDPMGGDRADFFSLGVFFDLPVFTANRQDKEVRAAVSQAEATRSQKWLLLRMLAAGMATDKVQLLQLESRQALYRGQLLPQIRDQAEASLVAYTNDDGDFAEVVRARIAHLNTEIEALDIDVDRYKTVARLNYYLTLGQLGDQSSSTTAPTLQVGVSQ